MGVGSGLVARRRSVESSAALLRPPGASRDFLASCLRCGLCVLACPFDTLGLEGLTAGSSFGTPAIDARENPCRLCSGHDSLLCIEACPTQALVRVEDHREIRMGVAVIDQDRCLAYRGVICRACWHACPFPEDAIRLDARMRVEVVADACIGCGICVHVCLTEPTSIVVQPAAERGQGVP